MKKWFVHPDGSLRIGLLSVLVFILVLALAEAAFEVHSLSKVETVKVRHVFEDSADDPAAPPKEEVAPPVNVPPPVIEVQRKDIAVPQKPEPKAAEKEMLAPEIPEETVQAEVSPEVIAEKIPEPVVDKIEKQPPPEPETLEQPKPSEMEDLVALLGDKETVPVKQDGARDFEISDDLRRLAASKPEPQSPQKRTSVPSETVPPTRSENSFKGTVVSDSEVRLPASDYNEMFKSWRNAGTVDDGRKQLSFRVQNLRKNYKLLQMKPVVVRTGRYFDLLNGAPLPEAVLSEYSSLQLVVEKPWQEWQPELRRLGVRNGDEFNVRYLLYGFIDRAMQSRVNTAFDCASRTGQIPAETSADKVEITGRVFQVSREGGGRFGVFVPRTLQLQGGETVALAEQCFATSADVQMLMDAGVL